MYFNANPDSQAIHMMITHVPENLKPCEKKKKFRGFSCNDQPWSWKPKSLWKEKKSIEDLVGMSTHDPENLNPCEEKK